MDMAIRAMGQMGSPDLKMGQVWTEEKLKQVGLGTKWLFLKL